MVNNVLRSSAVAKINGVDKWSLRKLNPQLFLGKDKYAWFDQNNMQRTAPFFKVYSAKRYLIKKIGTDGILYVKHCWNASNY